MRDGTEVVQLYARYARAGPAAPPAVRLHPGHAGAGRDGDGDDRRAAGAPAAVGRRGRPDDHARRARSRSAPGPPAPTSARPRRCPPRPRSRRGGRPGSRPPTSTTTRTSPWSTPPARRHRGHPGGPGTARLGDVHPPSSRATGRWLSSAWPVWPRRAGGSRSGPRRPRRRRQERRAKDDSAEPRQARSPASRCRARRRRYAWTEVCAPVACPPARASRPVPARSRCGWTGVPGAAADGCGWSGSGCDAATASGSAGTTTPSSGTPRPGPKMTS